MVTKDFSDITKRHSHLKHTAQAGFFDDENIKVVLAVPNSNNTVTLNAATVTIKAASKLKFNKQSELDAPFRGRSIKTFEIKDLRVEKIDFFDVRNEGKTGLWRTNKRVLIAEVISPDGRVISHGDRAKQTEWKMVISKGIEPKSFKHTISEPKNPDIFQSIRDTIEAYVPPKPLPPKDDNEEPIIDEPLAALVAKSKDPAMYVSGKKGTWIKIRTFK